MNEDGLIGTIARSPKKKLIILLAAVGTALLIIGSLASGLGGGRKNGDEADEREEVDMVADADMVAGADMVAYAKSLEERVVRLCEEVDGVSDVSVLLTLDGGNERVYAENGSGGSCVVISSGGEEKVVLVREIYSTVRGIAVVCRGGDNISVQKKLSELLSCALGVPISKISVAGAG